MIQMKHTTRLVSSLTALALAVALSSAGFGAQPARPPADARMTDANITRLTTGLLEHSQLAHHPFDGQLAGNVLDRYLDALDGTRSLFLQSDVDGFAVYRATLPQATRGAGDTSAAKAIFARYLERLSQQTAYDTLCVEDREVRLRRPRQLLLRSRARAAAGHRGGGPGALAAAAQSRISAGKAERQSGRTRS